MLIVTTNFQVNIYQWYVFLASSKADTTNKIQESFVESDKEPKALTWHPNFSDPNPI